MTNKPKVDTQDPELLTNCTDACSAMALVGSMPAMIIVDRSIAPPAMPTMPEMVAVRNAAMMRTASTY